MEETQEKKLVLNGVEVTNSECFGEELELALMLQEPTKEPTKEEAERLLPLVQHQMEKADRERKEVREEIRRKGGDENALEICDKADRKFFALAKRARRLESILERETFVCNVCQEEKPLEEEANAPEIPEQICQDCYEGRLFICKNCGSDEEGLNCCPQCGETVEVCSFCLEQTGHGNCRPDGVWWCDNCHISLPHDATKNEIGAMVLCNDCYMNMDIEEEE